MNAIPYADRYTLNQFIGVEWRPYLEPTDRDFVEYLVRTTIGWGRTKVTLTWNQMLNGVRSDHPDYTWYIPPVGGTSVSTLRRLINRLAERGVIIVRRVGRIYQEISINLDWTPGSNLMSPKQRLATPKRLREPAARQDQLSFDQGSIDPTGQPPSVDTLDPFEPENGTDPSRQNDVPARQNERILSTVLSQSEERKEDSLPASPVGGGVNFSEKTQNSQEILSLAEESLVPAGGRCDIETTEDHTHAAPSEDGLLTRVRQRIRAAVTVSRTADEIAVEAAAERQRALARAKQLGGASALHMTFRAAWEEAYPDVPCPSWSVRESHMMRATLQQRWPGDARIPIRHDFLDFVVRNWPTIRLMKFSWMRTSAPDLPTVGFLVARGLMPTFLDAFAERIRIEKGNADVDNAEYHRLRRVGKTHDEALLDIGERRALSRFNEEKRAMAKERADLIIQSERFRERQFEANKQRLIAETSGEPGAPAAPRRWVSQRGYNPHRDGAALAASLTREMPPLSEEDEEMLREIGVIPAPRPAPKD